MTEITRIDPDEFQQLGFLQEANRLFFHPLGLALEVVREDDGSVRFGGVWDYRDDPEGMFFATIDEDEARTKAEHVAEEAIRHRAGRFEALGDEADVECFPFVVQPIGVNMPREVGEG